MSGHSHWATIRRKKDATDAKRGAAFTKLAREIVLAARLGGGDPSSNVRLGLAVEKARASNMPKDNIERAIKRGTGDDKESAQVEELFYEGVAPHGIAVVMECLTENRNRTVADLRHILSRYGGNLAEAGAVSWQFSKKAYFDFPLGKHTQDQLFELAVEAGADDVTFEDDQVEIIGAVDTFKDISDALKKAGITPDEAGLKMIANNEVELDKDHTLSVMKAIEALEDLDDVQAVYSNLAISEEALAALEE